MISHRPRVIAQSGRSPVSRSLNYDPLEHVMKITRELA